MQCPLLPAWRSLYFLGMVDDVNEIPEDPAERARWMFARPACLELTHNHVSRPAGME